MSGKRQDSHTITVAERRTKVLAFRKAGASLRAIADELRSSPATVSRDVRAALRDLAEQQRAEAVELRALEAARLDDWQLAATRILQSETASAATRLGAIDRLVRISERRARLLGLDMQPGAMLPADLAIILRWHDDNRHIIDATPANDYAAAAPQLTGPDSEAPGAVQGRVLWTTMGQVEDGGDAVNQDRD